MKRLIFLLLMVTASVAGAQVTFEHAYDSASAVYSQALGQNQLMVVHFEVSGDRYVRINRVDQTICIYGMNHGLEKTISFAGFPIDGQQGYAGIGMYLSESLFDTDPGIEFMYTGNIGFPDQFTNIYNEDGSVIFADSGAPRTIVYEASQHRPIYNTSSGTKLILSYRNGVAKVYGLPGTLSTAVAEATDGQLQALASMNVSQAYPNPASGSTRIDFELPARATRGDVVLFDMEGREVRRFAVDRTFTNLHISTADIPAGTYLYHLEVDGTASKSKKMVVVR